MTHSKTISISLLASTLALGVMFITSTVRAASTGTVTATVTAQNISVSVADGSISYGTIALSSTADTTSTGTNDSQTATNDGNVTEVLNIRGSNSAAWTLAGTVGANQYKHEFCVTTCDSSPSWTALTTNYQTLAGSVSSSGTQVFDLKLSTPTSSASYTVQSVDVTVQATQ